MKYYGKLKIVATLILFGAFMTVMALLNNYKVTVTTPPDVLASPTGVAETKSVGSYVVELVSTPVVTSESSAAVSASSPDPVVPVPTGYREQLGTEVTGPTVTSRPESPVVAARPLPPVEPQTGPTTVPRSEPSSLPPSEDAVSSPSAPPVATPDSSTCYSYENSYWYRCSDGPPRPGEPAPPDSYLSQ